MAMPIKRKIREGKRVIGTMLAITAAPNLAYLLKNAGLDFVIVDCEHGAFTYQEVSHFTAVARALDLGVIVRICQPDRQSVQKFSDMGIDGIMLPMAEDAGTAERIAAWARYKPRGVRGMGLGPLVDYKTGVDLVNLIADINNDYVILTQIETREGVERIDEIMAVDGVDGCFFGVYDMSISYDKPGEIYDPIFRRNISRVLESARKNGKILGHHFFGYEDLEWGLEQGINLVTWHMDTSSLQDFFATHTARIRAMPAFRG